MWWDFYDDIIAIFFILTVKEVQKSVNLARLANLPEGLYILPMFFSLFKKMFNDRLSRPGRT